MLVYVWLFNGVHFALSMRCRQTPDTVQGPGGTSYLGSQKRTLPGLPHGTGPLRGRGKQPPAGRTLSRLLYLKAGGVSGSTESFPGLCGLQGHYVPTDPRRKISRWGWPLTARCREG